MNVLDRAFGHPLTAEEHAAVPLAGGIVQQGYQCGMLWGAVLAAGAQAYRLYGPGPKAEAAAIRAAQRLVVSFRAREGNINCLELTETDWQNKWQMTKYLLKGGGITCMRRVMGYAPEAFHVINEALSESDVEVPSGPPSCAALLARKMGASEMHAVMAAGLAGGIGLSGGACGALGAALWIIGMGKPEEQIGFNYKHTWAGETIDKFLAYTGYEFECSEICGRKFESTGDHANYMRGGGCSRIIDVLSTNSKVDVLKLAN